MFNKETLLKTVDRLLYRTEKDCTKEMFVKEFVLAVKKATSADAAGLRLSDGDGYPYYTTLGFSDIVVVAEAPICPHAIKGAPVVDEKSLPCLDCMCGNVLHGRTDPKLPFFTAGGSFWTNSTTSLLAGTTEKERQARIRNRCHGEGYESICLVPIIHGDRILGLLQVNDRRRDIFTIDAISVLEGLCISLGDVLGPLADKEMEEKQKEKAFFDNLLEVSESIKKRIEAL